MTNISKLLLTSFLILGTFNSLLANQKQNDMGMVVQAIINLNVCLNEMRNEIQYLKSEIEQIKNLQSSYQCSQNPIEKVDIQEISARYSNNPDGMSTIHYAIKQGDINAVELLLAYGVDVNTKDGSHVPLTRAAMYNQVEITELLLKHGANVNFTNKESYSPLYYAAKYGSARLIALLVEHGADVNRINNDNYSRYQTTPLHIACAEGNYETVVSLVYNRARIDGYINLQRQEPNGLRWEDGTPLDWAICKLTCKADPKNLDLIKFLIENGATRRVIYLYDHGASDYEYCPIISQYLQECGIPQY